MKRILTHEEVQTLLAQHPEWSLEAGMLTRTWSFPSFPNAIAFLNQVADLAEQANHHPDIDIRYTQVKLSLISHDLAGLTPRDAAMIRKIDELSPE